MMLLPRIISKLFVGRKDELERCKSFLKPRSKVHILNIHTNGDGGIGKTQLLLRIQEYCEAISDKVVFSKELIDFYHTESRSRFGVMKQIVDNLNIDNFPEFEKLAESYQRKTAGNDDGGKLPELEDVETAFREDYVKFSAKMQKEKKVIVLFFDTYEVIQKIEMSDDGKRLVYATGFSHWIETQLFPHFTQNTRLVVSGRYPLADIDQKRLIVKKIHLSHFILSDTKAFWQECFKVQNDTELAEKIGSEALIETFHKLADGRPILLALLADGVNCEHNPLVLKDLLNEIERRTKKITESVTEGQKQLFEKALIIRVASLIELEDRAVTIMSVAYRRMTPEMFYSLTKEKVSLDNCREILLERLKLLSFIKYKKEDVVILHDEMRRLMVQHWWSSLDSTRQLCKEIAKDAVEYYDKEFLAKDDLSREDRETYTPEMLEYAFLANPEDGVNRFCQEFDIALEDGRYDYCDLLLREAENYHRQNPNEMPFPDFLEIELRRIRYNVDTGRSYANAISMVGAVLEKYQGRPEWRNSVIRGQFLFIKGNAELWSASFEHAVQSLKQAVQIFYLAGEFERLHQVNNLIGYAYYRQGKFNEATRALEQSRDGCYRSLVQLGKLRGRESRQLLQNLQLSLGNLARIDSYTGQFERAIRKAEVVLNITRNLPRNNLEIARARATVAQVSLDAGHAIDAHYHFVEAERLVQGIRDRLITGRIKTGLGILQYRVDELAYLLEYYRAEDIEEIIEKYVSVKTTEEVRALLEGAIGILEEEPVIKKELADAYYILGELYMVTPSKDHWQQAEEALLTALKWGEASEFQYRVVDTLESLVTLYYFWNGASELSEETRKHNEQKMSEYQKRVDEFDRTMYPDLFGKYKVTLGDIEFDKALKLLGSSDEHEERCDLAITALEGAFAHYVSAADMMKKFHESRYYLILRVFYNRLKTLIDKVQETKECVFVIEWLDKLQSVWTKKAKKFKDIYRYAYLGIQPEEKREEIVDLEDHIQNALDKGNFGWALLLNECLIGAYKSLLFSGKENNEDREQLILRLNAQSRFYRILGDESQATQRIQAAREELKSISDSHLREASEGYTDSYEGALKYRRGEYSKPLEFYLQGELEVAREKFDRQFPKAREEALQLLLDGEKKLSVTISYWQKKLADMNGLEEKTYLGDQITRHYRRLGETRFRIGELLMLNEQFDDAEKQKGALSYLQEAMKDTENSGNIYYYNYAMQSYINALYFSGKYEHPDYVERRRIYESRLEDQLHARGIPVQPSIMGRLRITQGDALFSRYFQCKKEETGEYRYIPREGEVDTRILKKMMHYYVEACDFMIRNSGTTQFDDMIRILQRRIELIADRSALQIIQRHLRDVWNYQEHLGFETEEEVETLDQFARIRGLIVQQ